LRYVVKKMNEVKDLKRTDDLSSVFVMKRNGKVACASCLRTLKMSLKSCRDCKAYVCRRCSITQVEQFKAGGSVTFTVCKKCKDGIE
jgi:hypothetical protein